MGFKPTHTDCIALTKKELELFAHNKKNVLNQAIVQPKPDLKLGIWNVLMK